MLGTGRRWTRLVKLVRWGDDFSLRGRRSLCNAFRDEVGKHLLVKTTAVLGPNAEMGDVQEAIHLHRLLRLHFQAQSEASDGSSRPTLDTLRFW